MSEDADVALDEVTEEVVETAVYSFCCSRDKQTILDRKVAVVFDIDRAADSNWRCRVPQGGWKRICINLVSNSLKYTVRILTLYTPLNAAKLGQRHASTVA